MTADSGKTSDALADGAEQDDALDNSAEASDQMAEAVSSDADGSLGKDTPEELVECSPIDLSFTGTPQAFLAPGNAKYVHIKAWGAGGNSDCNGMNYANGGPGGYTEAVFSIHASVTFVAIVGQLGHAGSLDNFGFGATSAGGLTGVFLGGADVTESDSDRALVIAGGGGSALPNLCDLNAHGGPGNDPASGGMPTMRGGEPQCGSSSGGGGGLKGGLGCGSSAGRGGTGYVSPGLTGIELVEVQGIKQMILKHTTPVVGTTSVPPNNDDADYLAHNTPCPPGTSECHGLLIMRFLCTDPPQILK